jgi:L-ascorbate metabolism protein UlaG (beta-lactamase superfamily)
MSATEPDIALVPVSGTYVMTADEAAKAVNEKIRPKKVAIPMHYGSVVGTEKDAVKFKQLVTIKDARIVIRKRFCSSLFIPDPVEQMQKN